LLDRGGDFRIAAVLTTRAPVEAVLGVEYRAILEQGCSAPTSTAPLPNVGPTASSGRQHGPSQATGRTLQGDEAKADAMVPVNGEVGTSAGVVPGSITPASALQRCFGHAGRPPRVALD
jgi:hypothetical protein